MYIHMSSVNQPVRQSVCQAVTEAYFPKVFCGANIDTRDVSHSGYKRNKFHSQWQIDEANNNSYNNYNKI